MILDHPPQLHSFGRSLRGLVYSKKGADLQDTSTFVFDRHGGAKFAFVDG